MSRGGECPAGAHLPRRPWVLVSLVSLLLVSPAIAIHMEEHFRGIMDFWRWGAPLERLHYRSLLTGSTFDLVEAARQQRAAGGVGGESQRQLDANCVHKDVHCVPDKDNVIDVFFGVLTGEECQLTCQFHGDCVMFTWFDHLEETFPSSCFLYNRCLIAGESRHSLTGPPSCTCSRSIACQGVRHNFVGFQENVLTEDECQQLCGNQDQCMFYTWFNAENRVFSNYCFLFSSCEQVACNCVGCSSGPPSCAPTFDQILALPSSPHPPTMVTLKPVKDEIPPPSPSKPSLSSPSSSPSSPSTLPSPGPSLSITSSVEVPIPSSPSFPISAFPPPPISVIQQSSGGGAGLEKPSGLNPPSFPGHGEERPGTGSFGQGTIGSGTRPKPKPGNGNAAAAADGGDKPWIGEGGKPTNLPQPSRPVAGVGGGNEGASAGNRPDQDRPLPDHISNGGTQGDEIPGGGDEGGLVSGHGQGMDPAVPGDQESSVTLSSGGEEIKNNIGNLGTSVGPGLGTGQPPDIESNFQNTGHFGTHVSVEPSGASSEGTQSSQSIDGNPNNASGGLGGSSGRPQGPPENPIENPGTQGETPEALGRPHGTSTGPGGEQESQAAGSSETPVDSSGTLQGTFGGLSGRPDGSLLNQDVTSGTQAGASTQGSGSPSGSLGTLGAESGSPEVFDEAGGGFDGEEEKPWSGGIIGEDGQSLLDGVESIHNSSHNIVNIFSENENVSIFSEDNKLEDFENTIAGLAGNSTVSNGLKAAILNYMPSLKWLFVFIDN